MLAFLVLGVVGLTTPVPEVARAMCIAMDRVARLAILPLCLASLASGVVQGAGTRWGLVRHWWVVVKLAITVVSTLILLVHLRPIAQLAEAAARGPVAGHALRSIQTQVTLDALAALLALLLATVLSVFKPTGMTHYGWAYRVREKSDRR